jgi:hypothetical protein
MDPEIVISISIMITIYSVFLRPGKVLETQSSNKMSFFQKENYSFVVASTFHLSGHPHKKGELMLSRGSR